MSDAWMEDLRIEMLKLVEEWFDKYSDSSDAGYSATSFSDLEKLVDEFLMPWALGHR